MAKAKKQTVSAHDLDRIIVRLPEGMREKIAALAEANGRSMTAEVVAALDQHLKGPTAFDLLKDQVSHHDMTLAYTDDRLGRIEAFIEKHRKVLEDIASYEDGFIPGGVAHDLESLDKRVDRIEYGLKQGDWR